MISTHTEATASTVSLTEDTSSNPPPYVQRCIEEMRSLGISVSRHRLYKEVVKAHSPKLRKKRRIGLALDQYEEIMIYKAKLGGVPLSLEVPSLLGESLHYLEDYLHVKGLFRKSPAVSRLRELEVSLSSGKSLGELQPPPHDVAGLVKSFLRSLPDPLFSEQMVSILTQCPSLLGNELRGILLACTLLSPASLHCLQAVLALLAMVAENYSENKMNKNSLAVVIAPTLFYNKNSLKKPLKERAITDNIIRVIDTMLGNSEAVAQIDTQGTADSNKWKERKRTGSLSDVLKVFPRKANKFRISSQPYPVTVESKPQFMSGVSADNPPVIKSVRGKRPLEKYKPLLTEAKRARLLEQSGSMKEVILRRQIQIKDNKLVRRNAFLQRRGIQDLGADLAGINTETAGDNKTTEQLRKYNTTPKIPYPFENIRKNLEFKFVSEESENPISILPTPLSTQFRSPISTTRVPTSHNNNNNQHKQDCSLDSTESMIHPDTSGDMLLSRSEESLENFADSLLNSNPEIRTADTHNFTRQTMASPDISQFFDRSSYTVPRASNAKRVNRQCDYFQCPENRVHINDRDVILPSSIHEIYISANGCSSTPINVLDSPLRVLSSARPAAVDTGPLPTQFGTIPLQRTLRLKDRSTQELPPSSPLYSEHPRQAHTDIPCRVRPPFLPTPATEAATAINSHSFTNSEISADTTGLTDSETPASFHREHAIRKSFRKLLSPAVSSKRDKPYSDRDSFEKNERSKSNSNPHSSKKNKPQRRWSLRGMFKSPTPPRPIIHTTVISSPIPVKLPFHPIFSQREGGYKQVPPIVKRPCNKDTPPIERADYSPTDIFSAEITPECPEWIGSPPSIISSENSDMTSSSEYKLNPHSKEDPLSELLPPLPPQRDATQNTVATPSDLTSEDILRDDSFSDTSFDTSPLVLDEESPMVHYPFIEASIFAKPHMGAIKVLPDLPPLARLKPLKSIYKPATFPRRINSFRDEYLIEEIDSETEEMGDSIELAKRSCEDILLGEVCVETNPLPDVADCVKLFEAMARPNSEARRDPNIRASFGGFYMDRNHNHSRLIKRTSMLENTNNI